MTKYSLVYTDEILQVAPNCSTNLTTIIDKTIDERPYPTLYIEIASPGTEWTTEEEEEVDCGTSEDYWISFITSWRGVSSTSLPLPEITSVSELNSNSSITVDSSYYTTVKHVSPSYLPVSTITKSSAISSEINKHHAETTTGSILPYPTAPDPTIIPPPYVSRETFYKNTTTTNTKNYNSSIFTSTFQSSSLRDISTPIHTQYSRTTSSLYPNNVPTKRRDYSQYYSRYTMAVAHNRTIRYNHGNNNMTFSNISVLLVCLALILMLM